MHYSSTLVPFETHHKHLSDKLGHVQRNSSRLIEGNDTSFENRLKTLNFPTSYLRKDYLGFAQLLQFIKSALTLLQTLKITCPLTKGK